MKYLALAAMALGIVAFPGARTAEAAAFAGSTYTFAISGGSVSSPTGTFPGQTSSGFCVASADNCVGTGLSGGLTLADSGPSTGTLNFQFFGESIGATQPFAITLSNFALPGSLVIASIAYESGGLNIGTFEISTPWDGSSVTFTGTGRPPFDFFGARGGPTVAFTVTLEQGDVVQVPEPGTLALLGVGLMGLFAARRRRGAA
jgi:hypothetical protein